MDDFEKEIKVCFLDEASQSLSDTEQCFLALETNPQDPENLNLIFRLAHNLKGSSKAVGFDEMGHFTHEFETFILKIKNNEMEATSLIVSFLLRCNDFLRNMVDGYKADLAAQFDIQTLINEMHQLQSGASAAPAETVPEVVEAVAEEVVEAAPELVAEVEAAPASVEPAVEMPAPVPAQMPAMMEALTAAATASPAPAAAAAKAAPVASDKPDDNLRVSLSKIEDLLNAVGEMVILQSVLKEQMGPDQPELVRRSTHQLAKVGKEIQDISMSLRMIPVKSTFQKMQRIVRDTSKALNKEVQLTLVGEETELDKTILEKVNDPLVHLIRNSVDHGIENAELRLQRGKSARGEVKLAAYHEGGRFVLEVKDDGGGLDPKKLIQKAFDKNLLKPGVQISDQEAYRLIFLPGFSTKEQVTDVSGRGVGMDVVRTNIESLGGEVQILSELGKGTTFRVLLPLTMAIIDGMVVYVNEHKFVIPMTHVHETLSPNPDHVQATTNMGEILLLRGENLPLYYVGDFFGFKSKKKAHELIALVIRNGVTPCALLVDDIQGQSQVVIKRLGPEFQSYRGVSGSTILGDGRPAFILEPPDLFHRGARATSAPASATTAKKQKGAAA